MAFVGEVWPPFWLCMLLIMIPIMTQSAMNDAEALLRIKESLKNPICLDSWKPGTSPCDETMKWFGLICGNGMVTSLRLKSLNLSGELDLLGLSQLQGLRVINIVNNSFSGPIPELNKLGALKAIYMSMNQFSGEIPSGFFSKMVSLKKIWFDNNNFSGPIPSSLAQLPRLLELHLNNNNFSGLIPLIGQKTLQSLDLSNNNLTGDIPSSLSRFDVALFDGNPGLCGPKLRKLCVNAKQTPKGPKPPSKPPPESLKMAYMLMGLSAFILVAMIIAIYMLVRKTKKEEADQMCLEKRNSDASFGLGISSHVSPKEDDSTGETLERGSPKKTRGGGDLILLNKGTVAFGLSDLMKAGAEVLGNGSLGSSYKAKLSNGLVLVVKRLKEMNKMSKEGFQAEMARLGRLEHPNVLAPLACHFQKKEKLVIYEYIPKGSLLYLLHGDRGESHAELNWGARLKIIKGVALGMGYIHRELGMLALPHGNLKSSNVLLGPNKEPLVVDYGLISIIDASDAASVLTGYKAPEAVRNNNLISPKCDVYSLGIIILEILTGKFPSQYHNKGKGGTDVVEWVKSAMLEQRELELLDPEIRGTTNSLPQMQKLLHIGADCTQSHPDNRLHIRDAITRIQDIRI